MARPERFQTSAPQIRGLASRSDVLLLGREGPHFVSFCERFTGGFAQEASKAAFRELRSRA